MGAASSKGRDLSLTNDSTSFTFDRVGIGRCMQGAMPVSNGSLPRSLLNHLHRRLVPPLICHKTCDSLPYCRFISLSARGECEIFIGPVCDPLVGAEHVTWRKRELVLPVAIAPSERPALLLLGDSRDRVLFQWLMRHVCRSMDPFFWSETFEQIRTPTPTPMTRAHQGEMRRSLAMFRGRPFGLAELAERVSLWPC
jgi:hypothetical protein